MYILSKEDHVFIIQNFSLKLKMQKVPQIKSDNHHEIPPLIFVQDCKYFEQKYIYILHNSQEGGRKYFSNFIKFYQNLKIHIK